MELLVTRKSLKVVLQGHFSGHPSQKTYTFQNNKLCNWSIHSTRCQEWTTTIPSMDHMHNVEKCRFTCEEMYYIL